MTNTDKDRTASIVMEFTVVVQSLVTFFSAKLCAFTVSLRKVWKSCVQIVYNFGSFILFESKLSRVKTWEWEQTDRLSGAPVPVVGLSFTFSPLPKQVALLGWIETLCFLIRDILLLDTMLLTCLSFVTT